jgi:uncharacterized protein DUF3300
MKIFLNRALSCLLAFALALPFEVTAQSPGQATASQDDQVFSQEQLDQLLAPIALYPDALLAQVLMASTYPLEIVQAARWVNANPNVKDQALEDAMQQQSWDPSVKSLAAFPQVLEMMNAKLEWTQKLGDAFLAQQEQVMNTVQRLRAMAQSAGNLGSSTEQVVTSDQTGGTTFITVEPANPQVVYVPTYDPMVVYGAWPYPAYPPYYWYPPGYVVSGIISFGFGVAVGAALWGGCNWGHGNVYINNVNRYNSFNRTTISHTNWQHNVDHRKGVAYRDQRTAQQYHRGTAGRDAQSREQFRGYADQARQGGNFAQMRGDRTGTGSGTAGSGSRPSVGTSDLGRHGAGAYGGSRPSASTGAVTGGGQPTVGTSDLGRHGAGAYGGSRPSPSTGATGGGAGTRNFGSVSRGGSASAFDGVGRGPQTRDYSSRGNASLGASRAGGGWSGGSAHTGGGAGGARTGGGGGRGGGGRR